MRQMGRAQAKAQLCVGGGRDYKQLSIIRAWSLGCGTEGYRIEQQESGHGGLELEPKGLSFHSVGNKRSSKIGSGAVTFAL